MRHGFTTGSCACAASKAACYMLLTGKIKKSISIITPAGIQYNAKIEYIDRQERFVSCAVLKDGGDDPDVTTGAYVHAKVSFLSDNEHGVVIDGGEGIGRITMPGLDQPVGNAAINSVPRKMIEKEVKDVCNMLGYEGGISILIYVPGGEDIAKKTLGSKLGIVGGISILGTKGIVEPMSSQALIDTIQVELRQIKELGHHIAAVSPGNYGLDFMRNTYGFDLDKSVKCSNYIGETIDMAAELGFTDILLTGHVGKLIKVSGGIMNTHSKEADSRMELLTCAALRAGCDIETAHKILSAVTTKEGIRLLSECNICDKTMDIVMDKVMYYLNKRAQGKLKVECIIYENDYGLLAKSEGALMLMEEWRREWFIL